MHLDILAREEAHVVDYKKVPRIGHGDVKGVPHATERNGLVFLSDIQRDKRDDVFGNGQFGYVYLRTR